ncbi:MAG: translocation/assembly module TamB domain-containing protein, partial [Desulfosudaceae bacterium]
TVSDLSGRLGEGEFSVEGGLAWDNFVPARLDLDITAEALPVRIPDMMEMRLDAGLKLAGTPEATLLSGEIMLLDGLYFRDVNLSLVERAADLGKRKRRGASRPERRLPDWPFLENLSLDISLGHRQPFIVDNNLALLSVRPQLNLGGTARNPIISGRAEISEGLVAYRETEFEVKKGVIDFVNPYRIEPEVDIRAESRVRQWIITLVITGTPENLDFQLSSNPPEEDVDILSLLMTGKTTREMGGSAGDGTSPEQMLAGLLAGRLEQKLARETGLDIVEVEYRQNGTEDEDDQEVRVTVGKELSRRLTVTYGMESQNGEMIRRSTGIYRLLEDLSVNAYQDTAGSFGGEMRYRLEFR